MSYSVDAPFASFCDIHEPRFFSTSLYFFFSVYRRTRSRHKHGRRSEEASKKQKRPIDQVLASTNTSTDLMPLATVLAAHVENEEE